MPCPATGRFLPPCVRSLPVRRRLAFLTPRPIACETRRASFPLADVPAEIPQPPLQPAPAWHHFRLVEQDRKRVRDRAVLDHERAVHIGFAERQFGIEQNPALGPFAQEPYRYRRSGAVAAGKSGPARGRKGHRAAANELAQEVTQQTIHRSTNGATADYWTHEGNTWFQSASPHHNCDDQAVLVHCSQSRYSRAWGLRSCVISPLPFAS